jgi:hypothetical protein
MIPRSAHSTELAFPVAVGFSPSRLRPILFGRPALANQPKLSHLPPNFFAIAKTEKFVGHFQRSQICYQHSDLRGSFE